MEGGFRITARKVFSSGSPAGQLLVTSAVLADDAAGPTVLHFAVPLGAPGVRIEETWRTMGMRATGSHDVVLDGVFVPDAAIGVRRPAGKWHPAVPRHRLGGLPAHLFRLRRHRGGGARPRRPARRRKKKVDPSLLTLVGEMENELAAARLALRQHDRERGRGPGSPRRRRTRR